MSETTELTATEVATRLLPLMKEYAAKLAGVAERTSSLSEQLVTGRGIRSALVPEAARLICLHNALDKPVTDIAREGSGLFEHAALEYYLRNELKLRLDELEEHVRFSGLLVSELVKQLKEYGLADPARKFIEQSGRYKAPF